MKSVHACNTEPRPPKLHNFIMQAFSHQLFDQCRCTLDWCKWPNDGCNDQDAGAQVGMETYLELHRTLP